MLQPQSGGRSSFVTEVLDKLTGLGPVSRPINRGRRRIAVLIRLDKDYPLIGRTRGTMRFFSLRFLGALLGAIGLALAASSAFAQSGNNNAKPPDNKAAADAAAKESQRNVNEIAEARRLLTGPAGNPECVWLGRRVVSLLWRDDLDTAFRHLDLYDRFSCPSGHIQATFRCLVRQPNIDPKAAESLNSRIHSCWIDPDLPASPTTAQAPEKQPGTDKQ
jgi:hypothetical protein